HTDNLLRSVSLGALFFARTSPATGGHLMFPQPSGESLCRSRETRVKCPCARKMMVTCRCTPLGSGAASCASAASCCAGGHSTCVPAARSCCTSNRALRHILNSLTQERLSALQCRAL